MNKLLNIIREIKTWFFPKQEPKVICIGLHKTGTTSLAKALAILGYRVKDYPTVRTIGHRFLWFTGTQLNDYNAFTDSTVIPLYKSLHKKFKNVKFILTTRELESWLNSCSKWPNFLRPNVVGKRKIYREKVLGSANYDEIIFRDAYKKHLNDIETYFQNRKEDLLVLDVNDGHKWEKLCEFLGEPVPDEPFPYTNKGKYHNYS